MVDEHATMSVVVTKIIKRDGELADNDKRRQLL